MNKQQGRINFEVAFGRVLGVAADASAPEVKAAYRAAALREHPDVSAAPDAEQRFQELSAAYGAALHMQCPSRLRLWSVAGSGYGAWESSRAQALLQRMCQTEPSAAMICARPSVQ